MPAGRVGGLNFFFFAEPKFPPSTIGLSLAQKQLKSANIGLRGMLFRFTVKALGIYT